MIAAAVPAPVRAREVPAAIGMGELFPVGVQRWCGDGVDADLDWAVEERPVSLEYNGISHAVMMATPVDLEDFAVGFSLTEGIVSDRREILDIEITDTPRGICLGIEITAKCFAFAKERRRSLAGRTGCGLCGIESLDQLARDITPVGAPQLFDAGLLAAALADMDARQPLRAMTGATHAAAWMEPGGQVVLLREDVGRHNALDKLIGALARTGADPSRGAALITSRASYEMVQKAAVAGIGVLVAVSAPTGLAIRTARELNLTLAGFARHGRHVAYAHAWRLHGHVQVGGIA